ncbi:MAG TPA: hypothetical protein VEJ89_13030 [Myxococcaceae bacterium]|nr:hypothetical protein [Myxococcaceae bacterium]
MSGRPRWATLLLLAGGMALAAAAPDGGSPAPAARDAGSPRSPGDAGAPRPLTAEDLEIIRDLDLVEHLGEAELLDLLLEGR